MLFVARLYFGEISDCLLERVKHCVDFIHYFDVQEIIAELKLEQRETIFKRVENLEIEGNKHFMSFE